MTKRCIKAGFVAAGLINIIAVLVLSRGFTNQAINDADPVVMSNFGLMMIVIWGLVFLGASKIDSKMEWLAGAFAVEKLVYVISWVIWFSNSCLKSVYEKDLFAGIFYTVYGLNDFVFMIFFYLIFRSAVFVKKEKS